MRLAFIPQENPEKLLGDIEAVTAWLSGEIGVPVEGFVTIDQADRVVEAVAAAAQTGRIGDGKIFVTAIESALRIRTGETDADAV